MLVSLDHDVSPECQLGKAFGIRLPGFGRYSRDKQKAGHRGNPRFWARMMNMKPLKSSAKHAGWEKNDTTVGSVGSVGSVTSVAQGLDALRSHAPTLPRSHAR